MEGQASRHSRSRQRPRLIPRLAALVSLLVAGSVLLTAHPAAADPYGSVDCQKEPTNPRCVITVGTSSAPGSQGSSGTSACHDQLGRVVPCFLEGSGWYGGGGWYSPAGGRARPAPAPAAPWGAPPAARALTSGGRSPP